MTDVFATIRFYDTEAPEINVTNFPENVYVDQSVSLPYSSVGSDDFSASTVVTLKIYFLEDEKENAVIAYQTDSSGKYVYEVETDEDGRWLRDEDGILKYVKVDGEYKKIELYEYVDEDEDGAYVMEDGKYVLDPNTNQKIRSFKLDEDGNKIPAKLEISHSSGTFTPAEKGKYVAVYTVKDAAGNELSEVFRFEFEVTDAPPPSDSGWFDNFEWTTLTIISACVGGASLLGIIVVLLWPLFTKKKA